MRKLEVNRIYKHFKGDYYIVLGTGINSETHAETLPAADPDHQAD